MEILFLGTSAGTPTRSRNVSAIALIEGKGKSWHLIDCGEGTQHQILRSTLSLHSLSSIFITHLHGDHCYGLPGLLASAGLNGRTTPLRIVAPECTQQWIELTQKISDLHLPFELEFVTPSKVHQCHFNQFSVEAITLSHRIECYGFTFTETNIKQPLNIEKIRRAGIPEGPLWGKIHSGNDIEVDGIVYQSNDFCDEPRAPLKIIICGDNDQPDLLESECRNCNVLIHESTFSNELSEKAKRVGHSYVGLIASFAERMAIPNLILTHISARYAAGTDILKAEAKQAYSGNVFLACDFERYQLRTDGELKKLPAL